MATALNNSNIEKIKKLILKEGYLTSFWREYRSNATKGCGVGKALDNLKKLGVPKNGDPSKGKLDQMPEIIQGFDDLSVAMLKARGKCGGGQKHTKEFCVAYGKHIEKLHAEAVKLAQGGAQKAMAKELLKDDPKKEKGLDPKVIQANTKAILEAAKKYTELAKWLVAVQQTSAKAAKLLESKMSAWASQRNNDGIDTQRLDAAMEAAIKKIAVDAKIKPSFQNMQKTQKELQNILKVVKKIKTEGIDPKVVRASSDAIKKGDKAFDLARKAIEGFLSDYKGALQVVAEGRNRKVSEAQVEGH
ncbi:hypothetical protein [Parasedimentitalea maritima]|uniref:Uncharacterized protein n=1 Tax=Parasedimentitalea maritima TaxID=2578117 RepID=A0A6A4RC44_9RHOB|nr:hypothetical protein [Zongyanglinia marina]KAE9628147.1 hypothetical protein GP644_16055 [Zongyanglinia marina]